MLGLIATSSKPAAAQGPAPNFADPIVFNLGVRATGLAVGDLNLDGAPDLAVVAGPCPFEADEPGPVVVLMNTGDWSPATDGFLTPEELGEECELFGQEVVIALLDDDIYPDIAATVDTADGLKLYLYINNPSDPNNPFNSSIISITSLSTMHGLVASDFDNDGDNDLAIAGATDPNQGAILVLANDGDAGFTQTPTGLTGFAKPAFDLAADKFDDDAVTRDLAICSKEQNSICQLRGNGDRSFDQTRLDGPTGGAKFYHTSISGGRLDSDTIREAVCPFDDISSSSTLGYVDVYRHDPSTFDFIHERPSGDDSGDNYYVGNYMTLNGSDVGRVNGGTQRDAVFALSGAGLNPVPDSVLVVLGNGDGTLYRSTYYLLGIEPPAEPASEATGPVDVILVDLNEDGLLDIVTANKTTLNVSVLLNSYTPIEE